MSATQPSPFDLPPAADAALEIARKLAAAGHRALLAGGCVRDLLRGAPPTDYDVATDAVPERVAALFRPTRHVGAQFGVVLVRQRNRWVEVATFRTDGEYRDGRRPDHVTFSTPEADARRRDFTVNGMFYDPAAGAVLDYVGGQADLRAGLIRAIGEPAARFAEDHLRLLRAVRFAARLGFQIEPATAAAIRREAALLARVATERVREEFEKMLADPSRAVAVRLLRDLELLPHVWGSPVLTGDSIGTALRRLERVPADAGFVTAFAVLTASFTPLELDELCRRLTCSNEQRAAIVWLVENQSALDDPQRPPMAQLKRLMAHPAFASLTVFARLRYAELPDGTTRGEQLDRRLAAIPADAIAPPPLVRGDDLAERGIPPGPIYAELLKALYTRQLDEELRTRTAALAALDDLLQERRHTGG